MQPGDPTQRATLGAAAHNILVALGMGPRSKGGPPVATDILPFPICTDD